MTYGTYCLWILLVIFIIFCVACTELITHPYFVVISADAQHLEWLEGASFDFQDIIFTIEEPEEEISFSTKFRLALLNLLPAKTFFFIDSARHGTPFDSVATPYNAIQPWIGFIHDEPLHILFYEATCDVMMRYDKQLTRAACQVDPESAFDKFVELTCQGLDNSTVIIYHNIDSHATLEDVLDETRRISSHMVGYLILLVLFLLIVFTFSRRLAILVVVSSVLCQLIIDPVAFSKGFSYIDYFTSTPEEESSFITTAFILESILTLIIISLVGLSLYMFFTLEWKKRVQVVGIILGVGVLFSILHDPFLFIHTVTGLFN